MTSRSKGLSGIKKVTTVDTGDTSRISFGVTVSSIPSPVNGSFDLT